MRKSTSSCCSVVPVFPLSASSPKTLVGRLRDIHRMSNLGAAPAGGPSTPGGELFKGFSSLSNRVCVLFFPLVVFPQTYDPTRLVCGSTSRRRNWRRRIRKSNLGSQEFSSRSKGFRCYTTGRSSHGPQFGLNSSSTRYRRLFIL